MNRILNLIVTILLTRPVIFGACSQDKDYDVYLLALQRPVLHEHWNIHGLWPSKTYDPHNYPCFCSDEKFDVLQIKSIINDMEEYWPSNKKSEKISSDENEIFWSNENEIFWSNENEIFWSNENEIFWSHEYEKHGSCVTKNQTEYFSRTLELTKKHNPYKNLVDINKAMSSEILSKFDKIPMLGCKEHKEEDKQYLVEMGLCFSKDFILIDCPFSMRKIHDEVNNCITDKEIIYTK